MHDLVVCPHLRWDSAYRRPQHLLYRLPRGRPVFFVEEPEHTAGPAGIFVSSPCCGVMVLRGRLPIDEAGLTDAKLAQFEPLRRDCLAEYGVENAAAWFHTPMALAFLNVVLARAVVDDCVNELSAFAFAPPQLLQREAELPHCADLVMIGGPSLHEAKKWRHANVHCFPSSVDVAHFAPAVWRVDDSGIAHPRLEFFGVIDKRSDIGLVAALVKCEPEWQIVMVGRVIKTDRASLLRAANIHWPGQQPYATLPDLVQGWQVCLLPAAFLFKDLHALHQPDQDAEIHGRRKAGRQNRGARRGAPVPETYLCGRQRGKLHLAVPRRVERRNDARLDRVSTTRRPALRAARPFGEPLKRAP